MVEYNVLQSAIRFSKDKKGRTTFSDMLQQIRECEDDYHFENEHNWCYVRVYCEARNIKVEWPEMCHRVTCKECCANVADAIIKYGGVQYV